MYEKKPKKFNFKKTTKKSLKKGTHIAIKLDQAGRLDGKT